MALCADTSLLESLLFHLDVHLLMSLIFEKRFFREQHVLLDFSLNFYFALASMIKGHTQLRNSNPCQEPGPTEMSDGMRSTKICQEPLIVYCLMVSFVFCLLSLSSFSM